MQIIGNESPLILGSRAEITCSSDLDVLVTEWLYDGRVIVQSEDIQASLVIPAVNDSLHNQQFMCRIITPYGVQERNTTITVTGTAQPWYYNVTMIMCVSFVFLVPVSAVNVSTSSEGTPTAGERYTISCAVSKQQTLSVTPAIVWVDPNGVAINVQVNTTTSGSTIISTASVEFNPLLTSHTGTYVCQVSLASATLSLPLNSSASTTVTVQSKTVSL